MGIHTITILEIDTYICYMCMYVELSLMHARTHAHTHRGGGVILYVKESIQAYEIKLESEADYDEAVWCKIVSGNSKLTIGLVYRSPNINKDDNTKIQNAIKEVSKGECIIMGDFNHGHIQWKSLESTGGEDQQFLFLIQESFLTQHVLEQPGEKMY